MDKTLLPQAESSGQVIEATQPSAATAPEATGNLLVKPPRRKRGRTKRPGTSPFADLPQYLQDNEFITDYYRIDYSFSQTLRSLFSIHNESGNIWTHLVGFAIFLGLTWLTISSQPAPLSYAREVHEWLQASVPEVEWHTLLSTGWRSSRERVQSVGEDQLRSLAALKHWLLMQGPGKLHQQVGSVLSAVLNAHWPVPRWPMHVFTAGACMCLLTSSICHLFGCCQLHISQAIWRFDYCGIVVLIVSSFVPGVYYTFLCDRFFCNFYLGITLLLGAMTACVALMTFFQAKRFRPFRAGLFVALGLFGAVPAAHAWLVTGPEIHRALQLNVAMGLTYLVGATVYALRIPERWKPGAFDIYFHSHQLFHIAVIIAAALHYKGLWILMDWRDATGGCLSSVPLPALSVDGADVLGPALANFSSLGNLTDGGWMLSRHHDPAEL